jgi:NADPH-dependent 2,4-dienoyl-CoA reductase/sulfur reductase-like enzyme
MASEQMQQLAALFGSGRERFSRNNLGLQDVRDICEGLHAASAEPEGVTYAEIDAGGSVVIVGAGPAGVATAVSLRDRGIRPILIDRADQVASVWRTRYDMTKLMTGKRFSHMPGLPYPKGTQPFPTGDEVANYFDHHARQDGIELRLGTEAKRIDPQPRGWQVATTSGDIGAGDVVVATGYANTPYIPTWPNVQRFSGELLHSAAYRCPDPYRGKRVLVIGSGPSGLQVAHDLSKTATKVWLAVRTPPNILLRNRRWGVSAAMVAGPLFRAPVCLADAIARSIQLRTVGDLTDYGLPLPNEGPFACAARNDPVTVVDMDVIGSVRNRSIEVVSTVDRFHAACVSLVDGTRLEPDVVICATGYRPGLEPLVGHLDVLDTNGAPKALAPDPAASGLWFIGYERRPTQICHAARRSRQLAKRIAS